jgi:glycosyltransferase involved in cell wall biosynthesis
MKNLSIKIQKVLLFRRQIGNRAFVLYVLKRFLGKNSVPSADELNIISDLGKADYVKHFAFLNQAEFGLEIHDCDNLDPMSINWVIPDIGMGSGGHLNIFRLIGNLEKLGFRSTIVINGGSQFKDSDTAKKFLVRNFLPIEASIVIGQANMKPAWFTFATSWQTAYTVRGFRSTIQKCYFVQDFEPWFYPPGSEYVFAEETYRFNFYGVTAGSWLAKKLADQYGMRTAAMSFSYDKHLYRVLPKVESNKKCVFFYARPNTPRRGFELGLLVLDAVAKRVPGFHAVIAGVDTSNYKIDYSFSNCGIARLEDLPALYSQCDAALVLSFTNLSLLPLEVMACGCPVVSNAGANVEWLLNSNNSVLVPPTAEALAEALVNVLDDHVFRRDLIKNGLAFSGGTDWLCESRKVAEALAILGAERIPQ